MGDTDRLKKLEQQREAINQKIRREKAKQADEERKIDTRRKIIIGASVIGYAERHPEFQAMLEDILKKGVAEKDHYLFPELFGSVEDRPEPANDNDGAHRPHDGEISEGVAEEFRKQG